MKTPYILFAAYALIACGPAPHRPDQPQPDPTAEAGYAETVQQLTAMNREAEALFQAAKFDQAAAIVTNGQGLENRLLSVPRPSLTAVEAASDLDHLYGRMLLRNRQYGWARSFFQKNLARWKSWKPRTADTERRWSQAAAAIAECDRRLAE